MDDRHGTHGFESSILMSYHAEKYQARHAVWAEILSYELCQSLYYLYVAHVHLRAIRMQLKIDEGLHGRG